jgi:hypothetical protein
VIAAAFPATPVYAAWRFILVLVVVPCSLPSCWSFAGLHRGAFLLPPRMRPSRWEVSLSQVQAMITGRAPGLVHAVTLALAVSAAELLYRMLDMRNGY